MKHLRKKQKNHFPFIITLAGLILVAGAASMPFIMQKGGNKLSEPETIQQNIEINENSASESADIIEVSAEPIKTETEKPIIRDYQIIDLIGGKINTPYGKISYPEELSDHLVIANTNESPYVLEFYAVFDNKKELRLFDISIGEGSGGNVGHITTPEGKVPLNITIYTLASEADYEENEMTTAYAMQDAINGMIAMLDIKTESANKEVPVAASQPNDNGTINNIKIETPICPLYYPSRYYDTLRYTVDNSLSGVYKVHFLSSIEGIEDKHLFSFYFGGDEGEQLGTLVNNEKIPVPVYLIMKDLNLEDCSEEQKELLYTMQESCNEVIERLPLLNS